ncbi:hypothetical protein [uncultured Jannaschia sp.]|uniref:hypothetical protein n=1 Tax=uncultured Jannaschia sp. TaxID=293347 RepID=UPI00260EAD09|nr:hypothetical protein [uncultured Jannaschia sp.]
MTRPRMIGISAAILLVAGFAAANAHLVTVAIGTQPDCVLVTSQKEGAALPRAAKPSC